MCRFLRTADFYVLHRNAWNTVEFPLHADHYTTFINDRSVEHDGNPIVIITLIYHKSLQVEHTSYI